MFEQQKFDDLPTLLSYVNLWVLLKESKVVPDLPKSRAIQKSV